MFVCCCVQGAPSVQMKEMPPAFFVDMDSDDEDILTDEQKRVRDMERSLYKSNEYYSSKTEFKGAETEKQES